MRLGTETGSFVAGVKELLNIIRRAILLYQIRSIEVTIDGQGECLALVDDLSMWGQIIVARIVARRELARLRAEYNATFPPGKRVTWRMA
jgi:hypothetical protein